MAWAPDTRELAWRRNGWLPAHRWSGLGLEWTHTASGLVVHFAQGLIVEIGLLVAGIVTYLHTRRARSSATAEYENLSRSKTTGGTS